MPTTMPPAGITYRPKTDDDRPFLCELYASTRADELAQVPWSAEQKAEFLTMQFNAQWSHYADYYPDAEFMVVERDGKPIGRLYLDRGPEDLIVVDIALLPEERGKGLGRLMMQEVLDEAAATEKYVNIYVERYNPAMHLYVRLGFEPIGESGVYFKMRWTPAAKRAATPSA
jgi:GNAT superfamily N-acetyltransferase